MITKRDKGRINERLGLTHTKYMYAAALSHFSRVRLCATPWTAAYQAPLSMGFSRQECWSGVPFWVINPNIQYALQYVLSAFLFFQRVFLNCGFSILFYCQSFHILDLAYLPVIFIIFFLILFCFCFILLFKH